MKPAPKKKSTRRTKAAEEEPAEETAETKNTEDILNELMEKAKKAGKISTKEIAALEEKGVDADSIAKFYDALEANKIDIDISDDDAATILDDIDMPEIEEGELDKIVDPLANEGATRKREHKKVDYVALEAQLKKEEEEMRKKMKSE